MLYITLVNSHKIRQRKFKVIMDLGNGVQGSVAPLLLRRLGCQVITINGGAGWYLLGARVGTYFE